MYPGRVVVPGVAPAGCGAGVGPWRVAREALVDARRGREDGPLDLPDVAGRAEPGALGSRAVRGGRDGRQAGGV
eukprot:scaffold418426_cov23-Prasinocladus_malaysianus.AAC.1